MFLVKNVQVLVILILSCSAMDLANWMGDLPASLHGVPLTWLAIPGSHDSFSYTITPSSDIAPDERRLQCFGHCYCCGSIVKKIVFQWTVTQSLTCLEQLNEGVRYFDFRLASRPGTVVPFVVHGMYGSNVIDILKDIRAFLSSHKTEIVLLDFQHFYAFTDEVHNFLISSFGEIFGRLLCPYSKSLDDLVLARLWQSHQQVIIIYRDGYPAQNLGTPIVWPSANMPTPWPNTAKTSKLIRFLQGNYDQGRDSRYFFVTQGVLTPDIPYILLHLYSSLERKLAPKANRAMLNWLQDKPAGRSGINIVIADFIGMLPFKFTSAVISMNSKLAENLNVNGK